MLCFTQLAFHQSVNRLIDGNRQRPPPLLGDALDHDPLAEPARSGLLAHVDLGHPARGEQLLHLVGSDALRVHDGPDVNAPTVAGSPLQRGAVVQGLADQGGWKQVSAEGGVTGWVSAQYLQAADPVPA